MLLDRLVVLTVFNCTAYHCAAPKRSYLRILRGRSPLTVSCPKRTVSVHVYSECDPSGRGDSILTKAHAFERREMSRRRAYREVFCSRR